MDTEALREWEFWENLSDENRAINTEGDPPYDAVPVAKRIIEALVNLDMTDGPILDLGCGTGRLTLEMAAQLSWHQFYAVDVSQRMLELVEIRRQTGVALKNIRGLLGDGRRLPLEGLGTLAGAYSIATLQHLPHEAQASYLAQVSELLRFRGRFVFTIAVGSDDRFLSHQVSDRSILEAWCMAARLVVLEITHDDPRTGWTWVVTERL